jgi:hypothetical protein
MTFSFTFILTIFLLYVYIFLYMFAFPVTLLHKFSVNILSLGFSDYRNTTLWITIIKYVVMDKTQSKLRTACASATHIASPCHWIQTSNFLSAERWQRARTFVTGEGICDSELVEEMHRNMCDFWKSGQIRSNGALPKHKTLLPPLNHSCVKIGAENGKRHLLRATGDMLAVRGLCLGTRA